MTSSAYLNNTAGMVTQKTVRVGSALTTNQYVYDDLDRLIAENNTGAVTSSATFAYDLTGNRTGSVLNGVTNIYTYSNGCDRLVTWGTNSECSAGYNAAGCVTSLVFSATNKLYLSWNGAYELTQVATGTTAASVVERHGYDALGRRAWSWGNDGTVTNYYLYDGANLAAEVNSTGGLRRAYSYGPGIDSILSMTVYTGATVTTYFYLKDGLGTVHAVTDSTGTNIVERYVYDAWGKVLEVRNASGTKLTQSAIGNRLLWTGREYSWKIHAANAGAGLYFHRTRYYISQLGRWCSNDRIGIAGGLNQAVYCGDNPVTFADPFGLDATLVVGEDGAVTVTVLIRWIGATASEKNEWIMAIQDAWAVKIGDRAIRLVVHDVEAKGPLLGSLHGVRQGVFVKDNDVEVVRRARYFQSNSREWWSKASGRAAAHEVGHLVGLKDRWKGRRGEPTAEKWRGNIMQDVSGTVSAEQVEAMIQTAQRNGGYLTTFDGNSPYSADK